jgi:hypothetical protein
MKFKPGDKVWVDNGPGGMFAPGTYAGVLIRPSDTYAPPCWVLDIEGISPPPGTTLSAPEAALRPRFDPPPEQEPKREAVGSWDQCVWKPEGVIA